MRKYELKKLGLLCFLVAILGGCTSENDWGKKLAILFISGLQGRMSHILQWR